MYIIIIMMKINIKIKIKIKILKNNKIIKKARYK